MKQITEDYVSYEIAQLLKEKGFDNEEVSENGGFYCDYKCDGTDIGIVYESEMLNKDLARNEYLRPTHQMALKWLRLCYDIIIDVSPNLTLDDVCKGGFMAEVYQYGHRVPDGEFGCNVGDEYTYEQVVEASLLYVLKNLI